MDPRLSKLSGAVRMHPAEFFSTHMKMKLGAPEHAKLSRIYRGLENGESNLRIGVDRENYHLAAGVVAWRLFEEEPKPTLLLGGRRELREAWLRVLTHYIEKYALPCSSEMLRLKNNLGLLDRTGRVLLLQQPEYARPEGLLSRLSHPSDILIPDFEWTDKETLDEAIEFCRKHATILTVLCSCPSPKK